jgi:erythromycin esterase
VRHHGFGLVIFERGAAQMDRYDRYVTGAEQSLAISLGLYPWVTEEVRDLFAWLRDRNAAGGNVRLTGMDVHDPSDLWLALRLLGDAGVTAPSAWTRLGEEAHVRSNDPAWAGTALETWRETPAPALDAADPRQCRIASLAASFYRWLQHAALADKPEERPWELRDLFIAENALAELERLGPGTKALIWAHNGHVYHEPPVAGSHLRARLGSSYRSVCFAFGTGAFNAGSGTINPETKLPEGQIDWALRPHTAEPPPDGSMEHLLGRVDLDCYAVDAAKVGALRSLRQIRNVGAVLFEGLGQFSHSCVAANVYDILVYFREVHPSRLLNFREVHPEREGFS